MIPHRRCLHHQALQPLLCTRGVPPGIRREVPDQQLPPVPPPHPPGAQECPETCSQAWSIQHHHTPAAGPQHAACESCSQGMCAVLFPGHVCSPYPRACVWSCSQGMCLVLFPGHVCSPYPRACVWSCSQGMCAVLFLGLVCSHVPRAYVWSCSQGIHVHVVLHVTE